MTFKNNPLEFTLQNLFGNFKYLRLFLEIFVKQGEAIERGGLQSDSEKLEFQHG